MIPNLSFEPVKQQAWHLQIKDEILTSKRTIDKLSIKQINLMYENKKFLCDDCGDKFEKLDISLADHILHLINPSIFWSCDDCIITCMKEGRVIASSEPKPEQYQLDNA